MEVRTELDHPAAMRELMDRHEIYDCLMRYCRGVDRLDRDTLASAYHADAVDDHGEYAGPVTGFIDWVFALHSVAQRRTQHMITNHYCEIEGDIAHVESYYIFRSLNRTAPFHNIASGRYVDRFERRDGRWAIAVRVCLVDIMDDVWDPDGNTEDGKHQPTSRDRSDPSYRRPLTIAPERFAR